MIPAERVTQAQNAIDGLTALANATSKAGDTNITDAVSTLIAGYGGGGGDSTVTIDYRSNGYSFSNYYYSNVDEVQIKSSASSGLKINIIQSCGFDGVQGKIKYVNPVGFYSANQYDMLRDVRNIKEVDFGGLYVTPTINRWIYQLQAPANWILPCTVKIKGLYWDNWTDGAIGGTGQFTSTLRDAGLLFDIDWNGTLHNRSIKLGTSTTNHVPLTKNSMIGLFNALDEDGGTIDLGANNLAQLADEEKAIATSKGWTLT